MGLEYGQDLTARRTRPLRGENASRPDWPLLDSEEAVLSLTCISDDNLSRFLIFLVKGTSLGNSLTIWTPEWNYDFQWYQLQIRPESGGWR
jgi:hypothetical protein